MENEKQSSPGVFSPIPKLGFGVLTSLLFAGSVIFSLIHDLVFFSELGILFIEAPTTMADYLETWVIWFPIAIFSALIIIRAPLLNNFASQSQLFFQNVLQVLAFSILL